MLGFSRALFLLPLFALVSVLFTGTVLPGRAENSSGLSVVKLSRDAATGRAQLLRNGKPFFVRGAGGNDNRFLPALAAAGGNSLRLWGDEKLGETLDIARNLGLTVTAGIWLPQVRQGFDYTNTAAVAGLRDHVRATVERYRNHPALLIWALGNETEDATGDNLAVWTTINDLAKLVKELDPNHPVMTVIAEVGGHKVANLQRLCPAIDVVGINSYAGAPTLGDRYAKLGGTKPYIVTEFGPPGIWEIAKNSIGAYPEPTSTEKGDIYARAYRGAVLARPELCLGSYVFLWGQKQEVTATWFSMFLADGSQLAPVDVMTEFWTSRAPANRCPTITALELGGTSTLAPGATINATLATSDPEKDPLTVSWLLQRDPEAFGTGGDLEQIPPSYPDAILQSSAIGAKVRLPNAVGLYRLFATVRDNHGGGAVANLAVRVGPLPPAAPEHLRTLPSAAAGKSR